MYHYTESGLKNVYLRGGYTVLEMDEEEAVSIHDVDGLHKVIGQDIINKSPALTGNEIRFLRKEMNLTQSSFAAILSVSEDSVRGWENDRTDIPGPADKLIRIFYSKHADGSDSLRQAIEDISRIDREEAANERNRRMNFEEGAEGLWRAAVA